MTGHALSGDVPKRFHFAFGNEYTLVKEGDLASIKYQKGWGDARSKPPAAHGMVKSVVVSKDDVQRIWKMISALDLNHYINPDESNFEATPPDMRHSEQLHISVNDKTMVSWLQGYKFLKPDLRAPLAAIEDEIRELYNKLSSK